MNFNAITTPISATAQNEVSRTLVVFTYANDKKLTCDAGKNSGYEGSAALIMKAGEDGRLKGAARETLFFRSARVDGFENIFVIGLGDRKKITEENLRVALALTVKNLAREKITSAVIAVQSARKLTRDALLAGRAMAEGAVLGSYKYDELKSSKKETKEGKDSKAVEGAKEKMTDLTDLHFALADKAAMKKFAQGLEIGETLGEATNFARDLGNTPGNLLTPTKFAERFGAALKGTGVKYQALDKKQIQALKMGCLLGVNLGSDEEPRLMVAEYNGGKKSDKPLVLVGKGLTFDSGGISIKPAGGMEEMKFDMCGGAAVAGALLAIAQLKLKINVVAVIPSTENMPGGNATKPGDVLVAMNGKSVEVNNTDAEGRLILADALAYVCDKYEPAAIVDAATLTGACVVALGNVFAGYFCKDPSFLKQIQNAAVTAGEKIWQLPLVDEYVDDMKGTYADLSNIASAKGGGSSQGAAFLSQFVNDDITWAHFDIAGVAYHTGSRLPYNPDKGASGAAVRLFTQLAMDMA